MVFELAHIWRTDFILHKKADPISGVGDLLGAFIPHPWGGKWSPNLTPLVGALNRLIHS